MHLAACEEFLLEFVKSRLPSDLSRHLGASDIVQSVLFTVSRQRESFRGTTEVEFRAWICQIARNKIIDGIRRYRSRKVAVGVSRGGLAWNWGEALDHETPSASISLEEDARKLIEAIQQLPDQIRQIVVLRYAEGLTFEQIAKQLHLPTTTCRRRWLEGCQLLARQLHAVLE